VAKTTVPQGRYAEQIKGLLRSPEVAALIADLEATRWTGRPGYPIRTMVGMTLVKSLYCCRRGLAPFGWWLSTPPSARPSVVLLG
jgi:hypothetical protein